MRSYSYVLARGFENVHGRQEAINSRNAWRGGPQGLFHEIQETHGLFMEAAGCKGFFMRFKKLMDFSWRLPPHGHLSRVSREFVFIQETHEDFMEAHPQGLFIEAHPQGLFMEAHPQGLFS